MSKHKDRNLQALRCIQMLKQGEGAGGKIPAIRLYRMIMGCGLKEGKDAVDSIWGDPAPNSLYDRMNKIESSHEDTIHRVRDLENKMERILSQHPACADDIDIDWTASS